MTFLGTHRLVVTPLVALLAMADRRSTRGARGRALQLLSNPERVQAGLSPAA